MAFEDGTLPREVIIFGQRFSVRAEDPGLWAADGMGRASARAGSILISSRCGKDAALSTLLHECIHAALDITGQHKDGNEPLVGTLEAFMFSFIRDNGILVKRIAEME